jgi:DNA-binding FrmR family transcriptional regulator
MAKKTTILPPAHDASAKRLNRIIGQLNGIKAMMEERRYCPEILTQMRAARAAMKSLEVSMLGKHLDCCVVGAVKRGDEKEIKEKLAELETLITRYTE